MREFLSGSWSAFGKPLCPSRFSCRDRMCPRFIETKSRGFFFGCEFCGSFNHSAKWITNHAGIFPVGVVNAPKLVARLQSRGCAHGGSSSKSEEAMVCQAHKDRAQSV